MLPFGQVNYIARRSYCMTEKKLSSIVGQSVSSAWRPGFLLGQLCTITAEVSVSSHRIPEGGSRCRENSRALSAFRLTERHFDDWNTTLGKNGCQDLLPNGFRACRHPLKGVLDKDWLSPYYFDQWNYIPVSGKYTAHREVKFRSANATHVARIDERCCAPPTITGDTS